MVSVGCCWIQSVGQWAHHWGQEADGPAQLWVSLREHSWPGPRFLDSHCSALSTSELIFWVCVSPI